ncbi:MAG TPA: hypothetical protein VMF09_14870 [Solirubrobacteraceae bacterium]|nr:hypothetical protein [Solirubrobacteraceae bacterium]
MSRLTSAWRALQPEQRLAALAALGLFASMFLPWYSKTDTLVVHGAVKATDTSLTAFQAFSFVEAAVLLVSAAVLAMLFARAERRQFTLPGGDGLITIVAGGWCALLIFYRLLDKPGLQGNERVSAAVGVEWGIFLALLLALGLAYAGARMRASEAPAPPLRRADARRAPGAVHRPPDARRASPAQHPADAETAVIARRTGRTREHAPVASRERGSEPGSRPRYPPAPGSASHEQLSFEDQPTRPEL